MGCGSSSIADNTPPPIDWSRFEPTSDAATDQHHADELDDLARKYWGNHDLRERCLNQARRIDPNNAQVALTLAHSYQGKANYEGDQTLKFQNYARAEQLYAEAHRLSQSVFTQRDFASWADAVVSQGEHRRKDHDDILELKEQARPRDHTDTAKEASAALSEARFDEAVTLYRSAYDQSHNSTYLDSIARCYIQSHGLASPEARGATIDALRQVSEDVKNMTGDRLWNATRDETFLKGVLVAAPLYAAAQAKEKLGDLAGAAETGNAAFWALKHEQIIKFQYRVLCRAGRFKDCERMLSLTSEGRQIYWDQRIIQLYVEQGRYALAYKMLSDNYSSLPQGPEGDSLREIHRQCMASRKVAIEGAKNIVDNAAVDGQALAKAALFFYFENEHELSIEALQKAIAKEPNVGQYHGDLADSLYALKRRPEAESHYRKALSLDSTSLQRLIWSVRTGFDPLTAEFFTGMLKWDPHAENFSWIGSQFKYGSTYEGTVKAWDAITAYETALGLEPEHPQASVWRERLRYIEGLVKEVKAEQEMRRLHGDPTSRRLLGLQNYQRFGYGVEGSYNQFNTAYWQAQVPY